MVTYWGKNTMNTYEGKNGNWALVYQDTFGTLG